MTKRELIDKKSIMKILNSIDYDTDYECDEFGGNRVCFRTCDYDEVLEKVEYTDTIPEEEIVKPYLEKLKTEIAGLKRFELRGAVTPLVNANRVIELIDNLLTEKGVENGN